LLPVLPRRRSAGEVACPPSQEKCGGGCLSSLAGEVRGRLPALPRRRRQAAISHNAFPFNSYRIVVAYGCRKITILMWHGGGKRCGLWPPVFPSLFKRTIG